MLIAPKFEPLHRQCLTIPYRYIKYLMRALTEKTADKDKRVESDEEYLYVGPVEYVLLAGAIFVRIVLLWRRQVSSTIDHDLALHHLPQPDVITATIKQDNFIGHTATH